MRFEPDWACDLLTMWAQEDRRDTAQAMGYPSVSPTFKRVASLSDDLDVAGYSSDEIKALALGVEDLRLRSQDHYRALCRHFRPWMRSKMAAKDDDNQRVAEAVKMIADFVDSALS